MKAIACCEQALLRPRCAHAARRMGRSAHALHPSHKMLFHRMPSQLTSHVRFHSGHDSITCRCRPAASHPLGFSQSFTSNISCTSLPLPSPPTLPTTHQTARRTTPSTCPSLPTSGSRSLATSRSCSSSVTSGCALRSPSLPPTLTLSFLSLPFSLSLSLSPSFSHRTPSALPPSLSLHRHPPSSPSPSLPPLLSPHSLQGAREQEASDGWGASRRAHRMPW